ncbi:MAG: stage III sporulation protein AB [Bacillota bacterium]|nr:stage III sporulation protein AB [Bacillota bacterium]
MVRIFGCIIIIILSAAAGYLYTRRFTGRILILKDAEDKFGTMEREVMFSRNPLPDICGRLGEEPGMLSKVMYYAFREMNVKNMAFSEAWSKGVTELLEDSSLKPDQKRELASLGKGLGEGNLEEQKKCFERIKFELGKMVNEAEEEKKRLEKMYMSLFFFGGTGLSIILI